MLDQLTLFAEDSLAPLLVQQGKKEDSSKTICSLKSSDCAEISSPNILSSKTLKTSLDGGNKRLLKSKVLGTSAMMPSLMQEILESLKPADVGLQYVFKEECCLVHNIYKGFNEDKVRIFMGYSPTLRTPKGGGHLPSVLKKNGELYSLTVREAELLMGYEIGWTDLKPAVTP